LPRNPRNPAETPVKLPKITPMVWRCRSACPTWCDVMARTSPSPARTSWASPRPVTVPTPLLNRSLFFVPLSLHLYSPPQAPPSTSPTYSPKPPPHSYAFKVSARDLLISLPVEEGSDDSRYNPTTPHHLELLRRVTTPPGTPSAYTIPSHVAPTPPHPLPLRLAPHFSIPIFLFPTLTPTPHRARAR
jgi:hypothetical protein